MMLVSALVAQAAQAETVQTGTSTAQVLETIQYSVLLDMDFGKVATTGSGTITLDPGTGTRTCSGGLVCVGTFGLSQLQLTGSDANVMVSFDPTFTLTGPGDPILTEPLFPGGSGAVIHLTGGQAVVDFGARLHINPAQTPGIYSGDFTVTLEYN